jgi:hypothetical protein
MAVKQSSDEVAQAVLSPALNAPPSFAALVAETERLLAAGANGSAADLRAALMHLRFLADITAAWAQRTTAD